MRQGSTLRPKRVVCADKGNDGIPPPPNPPLSAASIFRQHPKRAKEAVAPPTLHPSNLKTSARAKRGSSSSPIKVRRGGFKKQDELHPLAAAFKTTTRTYRHTLYESTTKELDNTLSRLLDQLHDSNITTVSSPARASDPDGSPQKLTIADKADRTAAKLFTPIGSYTITVAKEDQKGEDYQVTQTLDDGIVGFTARHEKNFEGLRTLERKWETVVGEIWKVGLNCLGEDAMNDLLLTQPPALSFPPDRVEGESLTLGDLESKPTRKKVKFQEPVPKLPKFLSIASLYSDLPSPERVSEQETEMLKSKVSALGSAQIEELVAVQTAHNKWWKRKQEQMVRVLQQE